MRTNARFKKNAQNCVEQHSVQKALILPQNSKCDAQKSAVVERVDNLDSVQIFVSENSSVHVAVVHDTGQGSILKRLLSHFVSGLIFL